MGDIKTSSVELNNGMVLHHPVTRSNLFGRHRLSDRCCLPRLFVNLIHEAG